MVSARYIRLLGVSCMMLIGCANPGVPSALLARVQVGAVVGTRGQLLDLKNWQVLPLAPFVKSVVGNEAFEAYQMDEAYQVKGEEPRLQFVLASVHGRFLACEARDGLSVCVIEPSTREFSIVRCPKEGLRVSLGAWSRDENSLVCFCYRTIGERMEGHLYLLRYGGGGWSWVRLTGAGEVKGRKGFDYKITEGAWADDTTILFSSNGRIMRFDMRTQVLERGPEGHATYSFGKDKIVWQTQDRLMALFVMAEWPRAGEVAPPRKMTENSLGLNGWPVISPSGDLVLFRHTEGSTVWGHDAIRPRVCLYDMKTDRFYRLLRGVEREAPIMYVVSSGVWIRDDHGLRAAVLRDQNKGSFSCAMHPEAKSPQPGRCPKCALQLIRTEEYRYR